MQTLSDPLYVSAGVAASILGVNRRTIARWVAAGLLEALVMKDSNGRAVAVINREDLSKLQTSD
jgi:predicted site-specific integrase-resolvase